MKIDNTAKVDRELWTRIGETLILSVFFPSVFTRDTMRVLRYCENCLSSMQKFNFSEKLNF
jgi:hypothetical protein